MKKDSQLLESLKVMSEIADLGNDLVSSIERYGKYSKHGMSPHMEEAVKKWKDFIERNYVQIPKKDK